MRNKSHADITKVQHVCLVLRLIREGPRHKANARQASTLQRHSVVHDARRARASVGDPKDDSATVRSHLSTESFRAGPRERWLCEAPRLHALRVQLPLNDVQHL